MAIRVAYIISTLKRSGPVNQLYTLICNLNRLDFDPIIITLSKEPLDSRYEDFIDLGVKIISLGLSRIKFIVNGRKKLIGAVKEIRPAIIHSSGFRADLYVSKYLKEYRHCNTIHNYPFEDYILTYGTIIGSIAAIIHTKVIGRIQYPISCSETITNKLKRNFNINVYTVQNGIDSKLYIKINTNRRAKIREALNLNKSKTLFVCLGELSYLKGVLNVIKAFEKSLISNEANLIILGNGLLLDKCKEAESEAIIIKGWVNNPVEYLQACDIFVSASSSEGLPLAVLEAMGTGLPLILSDIEAHKEILSKNWRAGEMFKVDSINELCNVFKGMISADLLTYSYASRSILEGFFTDKIMREGYERIYRTMNCDL